MADVKGNTGSLKKLLESRIKLTGSSVVLLVIGCGPKGVGLMAVRPCGFA